MVKLVYTKKSTLYNEKYDYYSYLWFRYHNIFVGSLIRRGRKLWTWNFSCDLNFKIKQMEGVDPFWLFLTAMVKITPSIILFPFKMGGAVHGVPMPISERKRYTFAVKWVLKAIRDRDRRLNIFTVAEALVILFTDVVLL